MNKRDNKLVSLQHWQIISLLLMAYDVVAVNAAYFAALWLRFDFRFSLIPTVYLSAWLKFAPIYTVVCLVVFWLFRLYRSLWEFASYDELQRIISANLITVALHAVFIVVLFRRMPNSYYFLGGIFQFLATLGIRFSYRFILLLRSNSRKHMQEARAKRCMIIGAGAAGQMIIRDLHHAKEVNDRVLCIIDDNPNKWGRFVDGIEVVGGREDILLNVEKYEIEKILFAIPTASSEVRRDILNICKETGCELKSLPGMYELVNDDVSYGELRDVAVEDLLGREPISVDMREIFEYISGKVILVTGGGGSIGSELCRQIANHAPKQLIIFDIYENNAYDIQQELKSVHPDLDLVVLIGSVRDSNRINHVFATYRPEICFHAAAHKHVPLMEDSPCEAIKNNAIGTYKTAYAALMNQCRKFVLVSTDKAVNPTNIMGASKRLCEMSIQCFDQLIREDRVDKLPSLHVRTWTEEVDQRKPEKPYTEFVAVRFGNVLGSNGSVIPLFKKQIEKGGPVTVTHPDIIRYFMTIPEAVSLILQAGTYAKGGEIFVLDMGEPVKIDTLARNLIKLSGLRPDVDIEIKYVGLRPGEKLFEEKLMSEEGLRMTPNKLIHIGSPIPLDADTFLQQMQELMIAAYSEDEDMKKIVAGMVPTYIPSQKAKVVPMSQERQVREPIGLGYPEPTVSGLTASAVMSGPM